jgi:hypothetical protein
MQIGAPRDIASVLLHTVSYRTVTRLAFSASLTALQLEESVMNWLERNMNRAQRLTNKAQGGAKGVRRAIREVKRLYNKPGSGIAQYRAAGKAMRRKR